jgi:hemolysin activation/secretion protein
VGPAAVSAEARRSAGRPARRRGAGRLRALVASLLALGVAAPDAAAQIAPPERLGVPELERPELPPFERPPPVLPPAPEPPPVPERPSTGLAVFVRDVRLVGNTVFTEEELDPIVRRYEGRAITTEELLQLRDELTVHYVERGYINSGAVIPDQDVVDGVITVEIVEGRLDVDEIEVTGLTWLRPGFVEGRIRLGAGPPLNVNRLQERLQLLLTDPAIERLDARLGPGLRRGESRLEVAVREARRFTADLEVSNDRSTSVGEPHGEASQSSSPSSARRRRGIR